MVWGGIIGLTLDRNVHAGQVDGIWYSMGIWDMEFR
jgi:hypothetical protein